MRTYKSTLAVVLICIALLFSAIPTQPAGNLPPSLPEQPKDSVIWQLRRSYMLTLTSIARHDHQSNTLDSSTLK